ncbi:hypothetical protein [Photobacterium sp. 53610]|uniref:hypothetical protein n=1 Tax=Photobacterium sp. 53610 TaxID=3102789 RepID=UPI002ED7A1EC
MEYDTLNKWCNFCEGNLILEPSYFLTMFHDVISDREIEEIFKYFPCASELIDRVRNVQAVMHNLGCLDNRDPVQCLELAARDLSERLKASLLLGDEALVDVAKSVPKRFISDYSMVRAAQSDTWNIGLIENANDYVNSVMISRELHYYAIFEAFYGMTTLFPIKWYLCAPLTGTTIDFSNFFKLWELHGDYALTGTELLISQDFN